VIVLITRGENIVHHTGALLPVEQVQRKAAERRSFTSQPDDDIRACDEITQAADGACVGTVLPSTISVCAYCTSPEVHTIGQAIDSN
jgi:hypothetical protein